MDLRPQWAIGWGEVEVVMKFGGVFHDLQEHHGAEKCMESHQYYKGLLSMANVLPRTLSKYLEPRV